MGVKCSIVIPAYNAEKTIIECINSIELEREWKHSVEVIVINDGSNDLTHKIVSNISKEYKSVKLIDKENKGVSSARNEGIQEASGKYIYFMDADDRVCRKVLDEMIECAEKTTTDMIVADYIVYNKLSGKQQYVSSKICCNKILERDYIEKNIFYRYFVSDNDGLSNLWNKLFKKDIIYNNRISFNEKRTHGEDWNFVIDYIEHITNLFSVDKAVYVYRLDGSQSWCKYSRGLAYSLLDGHRIIKELNQKYSLCKIESIEYRQFMRRFYDQILSYLMLQNCDSVEKKDFLDDKVCKDNFKFILKRKTYELQEMQLSRKDKIIVSLLQLKLYKQALRIANRL